MKALDDSNEDVVTSSEITTIGKIIVTINGQTYEAEIDRDHYFYPELAQAARSGENPAEALIWLGDLGCRIVPQTRGTSLDTSRKNALGE